MKRLYMIIRSELNIERSAAIAKRARCISPTPSSGDVRYVVQKHQVGCEYDHFLRGYLLLVLIEQIGQPMRHRRFPLPATPWMISAVFLAPDDFVLLGLNRGYDIPRPVILVLPETVNQNSSDTAGPPLSRLYVSDTRSKICFRITTLRFKYTSPSMIPSGASNEAGSVPPVNE